MFIDGLAPGVTIVPVKVLADYRVPALPKCDPPSKATPAVFGTSAMVAASIDYVTGLALAGYRPMVINMSLGGGALEDVEGILKATALPMPPIGTRHVFDIAKWVDIPWDTDCDGTPWEPVGAGVIQADAALSATIP